MKNATISELKNHLSKYLRYVKQGEPVLVLDRGLAVAEICPRRISGKSESEDLLRRLEAKGIIRRGDPSKLKNFRLPKGRRQTGVLDALLAERREGR